MNYQIISSSSHTTTKWSGGTTTQLYIYPPKSSVEPRDFDFRISTAKVEAESSLFTKFLGYHRTLLILEGGIKLNHQSQHQKVLNKFDQDYFKGDWETSAKGQCVDFNVIAKPSITNITQALTILKREHISESILADWVVVYVFKGAITAQLNNEEVTISKGELLVISEVKIESIDLIGLENSEVIISQLSKKETKV